MWKKNTAVTGFTFQLRSFADGTAITTGSVTGYYLLDGGTQATISGTPTHEGNGQWSVDLLAAEMNGDVVGLMFVHASGSAHFTIHTVAQTVDDLNNLSAAEVNTEVDMALSDYDAPTNTELLAGLAALNNLSAAEVNAEVDAAIETYHLDHLLAADYDPSSKPGVSTALLNELVENDGGVSRFTSNALEQGAAAGSTIYWAEIKTIRSGSNDEWKVIFKEDELAVDGADVVSPTISVYEMAAGAALFSGQTLTAIGGSAKGYEYTSSTLMAARTSYEVVVSWTDAGANSRTWRTEVTRR